MPRVRRLAVELPADAIETEAWRDLCDKIATHALDLRHDLEVYATAVEACACGTTLEPCDICGEMRCYSCDPEGNPRCTKETP